VVLVPRELVDECYLVPHGMSSTVIPPPSGGSWSFKVPPPVPSPASFRYGSSTFDADEFVKVGTTIEGNTFESTSTERESATAAEIKGAYLKALRKRLGV
jgi:hypothetical protein